VRVTDDPPAARELAAERCVVYGPLPVLPPHSGPRGLARPPDAALIGDEDTVATRLKKLRDAGVDEFLGMPFERAPGRDRPIPSSDAGAAFAAPQG
jgi:5,10-methylenetetrahydromethanopterin reductase